MEVGRTNFMKYKKRQSRDEEASFANAYLYLLLAEFDAVATLKYTKRAKKTVKLYAVETVKLGEAVLTQELVRAKGAELLRAQSACDAPEVPFDQMSEKQKKRSVEAEVSNGYLQLLTERGFRPVFRPTKSSRKTIKMLRVQALRTHKGKAVSRARLLEIGARLDRLVQERFNGYKTLLLDRAFVQEIAESVPADDGDETFDEDDGAFGVSFVVEGHCIYRLDGRARVLVLDWDVLPPFDMSALGAAPPPR